MAENSGPDSVVPTARLQKLKNSLDQRGADVVERKRNRGMLIPVDFPSHCQHFSEAGGFIQLAQNQAEAVQRVSHVRVFIPEQLSAESQRFAMCNF